MKMGAQILSNTPQKLWWMNKSITNQIWKAKSIAALIQFNTRIIMNQVFSYIVFIIYNKMCKTINLYVKTFKKYKKIKKSKLFWASSIDLLNLS